MRLKSVKLTHFCGYRATTVIPIDEAMTGIVGRNDYGKLILPRFPGHPVKRVFS